MYKQLVIKDDLHIHDLVELEKLTYAEAFRLDPALYHSWFLKNRDLYVAISDESDPQRMIGYIYAVPLKPEYAKRMREGNLTDSKLPADALIPGGTKGTHTLYFSSIVLHPAHRKGIVIGFLMDLFLSRILGMAHLGIYFSEVMADVVTSSGAAVAESFGMTLIKHSDHGSRVMSASMLPPRFNIVSRASIKLKRRYQEHFRQIQSMSEEAERRLVSLEKSKDHLHVTESSRFQ